MSNSIIHNINKLSINIPKASKPLASYLPFKKVGSLLYISGQLPLKDNKIIYPGKVETNVSIENAKLSAQQCVINILSQVSYALDGKFNDIKQFIQLSGYIASDLNFTNHHLVMNGASDLIVKIFGEAGKHSRIAVGCSSLPLNAPVEVSAIIEIKLNN